MVHRTGCVVLLVVINTDIFQNCTEYYEGLLNFMQGGCYLCILLCEGEVQVLEHSNYHHTFTFGIDAVGLISLNTKMIK